MFLKWKVTFESKVMKINHGKTKMMMYGLKGKICNS